MRRELNKRLKRLERRERPERPMTVAERLTKLLEIKHEMDNEGREPDTPFDWNRTYAMVRQHILDRGENPDEPY
jgi:hypothetical protein